MSNEMKLLERVDALELVGEPVAPKIEEIEERPWEMVYSGDLDLDAAEVLGYHELYREMERRNHQREMNRQAEVRRYENEQKQVAFAKVLAQLNISPFTEESVEHYKEKVRHANVKIPWKQFSGTFEFLLLGGIMGLIFTGYILMTTLSVSFCSAPLVISILCVVIGTDLIRKNKKEILSCMEWIDIPLRLYSEKTIPDYALALAVHVKQAYPDVHLGVCELVEKRKPRVILDPFFYAEVGGKRFYLSVWDEPGFFGVRQNEE